MAQAEIIDDAGVVPFEECFPKFEFSVSGTRNPLKSAPSLRWLEARQTSQLRALWGFCFSLYSAYFSDRRRGYLKKVLHSQTDFLLATSIALWLQLLGT